MTDKRGTTEGEGVSGEMMAVMGGEEGGDPERQTVLHLFKPRDFWITFCQVIPLRRCADVCSEWGLCVCV